FRDNQSDTPADHPAFAVQHINQVVVEDNVQPFTSASDATAVTFDGSCGVVRGNTFSGAKAEASGVQTCPGAIQSPAEPQSPRFPAASTVQRPAGAADNANKKAGAATTRQGKKATGAKSKTSPSTTIETAAP